MITCASGCCCREAGRAIKIPAPLAAGLLAAPVYLVAFCDEEGIRFK